MSEEGFFDGIYLCYGQYVEDEDEQKKLHGIGRRLSKGIYGVLHEGQFDMGLTNGWCREINFNGCVTVGWRKNDLYHGYNKYYSPNQTGTQAELVFEDGLYDLN